MYEIKEQKQLFYSTVHKAINALQKEGLVEPVKSQISEKGGTTTLFSLTFQGFRKISCFSGRAPSELWHPGAFGTVRDAELVAQKQEIKERRIFQVTGNSGVFW